MIELSDRTKDGMLRAYEKTLDSECDVYHETRTPSAMGETVSLTKKNSSLIKCRVDPEETQEDASQEINERTVCVILSISTSIVTTDNYKPGLETVVDVYEGETATRYRIKGFYQRRGSGLETDIKLKAVKS